MFDGVPSKPWQTALWCYTRVSLQCIENSGVFWALYFVVWNVVIQLNSDVPFGGISLLFIWRRNMGLTSILHVLEVMLPLWLHTVLPRWPPGCTQEMLLQHFLSSFVEGWVPALGWEQGDVALEFQLLPGGCWFVTHRTTANCSNEEGQLGGSQTPCGNRASLHFVGA